MSLTPAPTPTPTPARWVDPAWQSHALAWVDAELARAGRTRTGWTQPHVRPWSTAVRIETDGDAVWLKACGDGTAHESRLVAELAACGLPDVPHPLAVDDAEGWLLLPDLGATARAAHGGATPPDEMAALLVRYAALQRASEPYADRLVAAGADDLRPPLMPERFATLVEDLAASDGPARLAPDDADALRAVLPAYRRCCEELAASGIPVTIQHDDLHDANVFARGPVFFDWGDACVGHPFGTLLATLRSIAHHHQLASDDPALARVRDAYLERWTDVADLATLRRQAALAIRVGPLTRALAWRRALVGSDEAAMQEHGDAMPGWLLEVLSDDIPAAAPALPRP